MRERLARGVAMDLVGELRQEAVDQTHRVRLRQAIEQDRAPKCSLAEARGTIEMVIPAIGFFMRLIVGSDSLRPRTDT